MTLNYLIDRRFSSRCNVRVETEERLTIFQRIIAAWICLIEKQEDLS